MSKSKKLSPEAYMEKLQKKIADDLKEKNFATAEEANKYVQENYLNREIEFDDSNLSPAEQAQNLIYEARDCNDSEEAIKFAEKALKLDENCADAFNLLAELKAKGVDEALEFYGKGIEAGKKTLGKDFEEYKGHFWGFHETRPFMRSMAGYANALWGKGEKSKSIEVTKEMLVLNPDDNQGMRQDLITRLLILNRILEAEKLYNDYKDDLSAEWRYSKAYLYFIKRSKNMYADAALKEAMEYNPYVPFYIFGFRDMPDEMPEYVGFGDENEAIDYAEQAFELWAKNDKAAKWFANLFKKMEGKLNLLIEEREKERGNRGKRT